MVDIDVRCRCMGVDRRTRCKRDAAQEDGLCDHCRCPHGSCDRHGDDETYQPTTFFDDPMAWIDWFGDAMEEASRCRAVGGYKQMKQEIEQAEHAKGE
jgi:hypothetical protein